MIMVYGGKSCWVVLEVRVRKWVSGLLANMTVNVSGKFGIFTPKCTLGSVA